jgi:hypothetical protein
MGAVILAVDLGKTSCRAAARGRRAEAAVRLDRARGRVRDALGGT